MFCLTAKASPAGDVKYFANLTASVIERAIGKSLLPKLFSLPFIPPSFFVGILLTIYGSFPVSCKNCWKSLSFPSSPRNLPIAPIAELLTVGIPNLPSC